MTVGNAAAATAALRRSPLPPAHARLLLQITGYDAKYRKHSVRYRDGDTAELALRHEAVQVRLDHCCWRCCCGCWGQGCRALLLLCLLLLCLLLLWCTPCPKA